MPTNLIPTDSPLYLRRMVAAVRASIRSPGAYILRDSCNYKVTHAHLHKGRFIVTLLQQSGATERIDATAALSIADGIVFTDGNGQQICASREPTEGESLVALARATAADAAQPTDGSRAVITVNAPNLTLACTDSDGNRATIRWVCNDDMALIGLFAALSRVSVPVAVECDADYDGAPR